MVFGADWAVTMVGLDVTHKALLADAHIREIVAAPGDVAGHIGAALPLYREFYRSIGIDGVYLHDPSAIAYVLDPTLFRTARWPIRVETLGISRGKTWPMVRDRDDEEAAAWRGRPRIEVCVDVEAARLIELIVSRLSGLAPEHPDSRAALPGVGDMR
jgi:inosine-uridine nucleoside N-ribohydrolase